MGKSVLNSLKSFLCLAGVASVITLEAAAHFTPAYQGNGRDHLNIYLLEASIFGLPLQPGDEIAAFDGNVCCGVFVVSKPTQFGEGLSGVIHASRTDPGLSNGFIPGNPVRLRFWDSSEAREYSFVYLEFLNTSLEQVSPLPYEPGGSAFVKCAVRNLAVQLYVNLEGALKGKPGDSGYRSLMRTDLNKVRVLPGQCYADNYVGTLYTPAGQPYSGAPWYYSGTEGSLFDSQGKPENGAAGYPPTVVDWILVSLKDKRETGGNSLCRAAALLHSDGRVEFPGSGLNCGITDPAKLYYLLVEHRNHVCILSDALDITTGKINCNFREKQSLTDTLAKPAPFAGQKLLSPGRYALFAGNGHQTGIYGAERVITPEDLTAWETEISIPGRYTTGDYDMNGDCTLRDRIIWEMNYSLFSDEP